MSQNTIFITKASSGEALAGVPVYFRRNISSGGGGGGRVRGSLLRGFLRAFLKVLLGLTFGVSRTEVKPSKVPLASHLGA